MKCSAPVPQHTVHQSRKSVCSVLTIFVVLLAGFAMTPDVGAASKPPLPLAPTGLTATALSLNQIQLTWIDNSTNESGFKIERAPTASGSWKQIGTVTMNVTSYTSTGLAPATTYYFRVRAYNSRGNSSYTTVANATTFSTASPCSYSISANSTSADASGAAGSVNVTAGANCA